VGAELRQLLSVHGRSLGSADALALATDHDGSLDGTDDSYAPYWPGDRYGDRVGMSLYH
jgi:hypothetical protein